MGARIVLALCAGPLLAGAAAAQEADWYQAVSFGAATTRIPESVVSVAGGGASTLWRDERDPGVKVLVGHEFSRHWAVEGGFAHLGEFNITRALASPPGAAANASLRVKGWIIDGVGTFALGNGFSALGRVGVLLSEVVTVRSTSGGATLAPGLDASGIRDDFNFKIGAGLQYALTPRVTLRAEWERFYRVGDPDITGELDIDLMSVGVLLRF
jgi:OmpA-OmpF porin, OOP family